MQESVGIVRKRGSVEYWGRVQKRSAGMKFSFRTVDVFSDQPFLGNPVAVILGATGLTTEAMQTITRWMNLSETTFVLPPTSPKADYRVRIFTLDRELPFAGHPTLGSCRAWLSNGGTPMNPGTIVQECEAGLIPIRRWGDSLAFAAPPLIRHGQPDSDKIDEVCAVLNIDSTQIVDAEWIDNGPGWLGVRLESAEAVLDVQPASKHPTRIEIGLVGPWPAGHEADFEVRALFSGQNGAVLEDPVTGSLNAAIAQWLLASGKATAPYTAAQGRVLGRAGRVEVSQSGDDIWIGGATTVIVDGAIEV
jgi:PhzF family phenazine biosynthesis protein